GDDEEYQRQDRTAGGQVGIVDEVDEHGGHSDGEDGKDDEADPEISLLLGSARVDLPLHDGATVVRARRRDWTVKYTSRPASARRHTICCADSPSHTTSLFRTNSTKNRNAV